ncbi:MAG: M15 family metallopeptidase [Spirochaetes bacterium]|nr:M15 family metallopeptidase [Spirochaetota bacterium]
MKKAPVVLFFALALVVDTDCVPKQSPKMVQVEAAATALGLSQVESGAFLARVRQGTGRFFELLDAAMADRTTDAKLLARVDKSKSLPRDYEPSDLVQLDGKSLSVSRPGHRLRKPAFEALVVMSAAAKADGLSLTISSAYRSYSYQESLFTRNVAEMGEKEASRVSARPGSSQHQLGTAIDFGSITDAFALTPASKWLVANARRFGFSLSYPKGMESVTGYVWESWHYRYIGKAAASLQAEYFDGVQHYLILFLDAYRLAQPNR